MTNRSKKTPKSPSAADTNGRDSTIQSHNGRGDDDIRVRAYELYLERGGENGDDLQDWLRAESEQRDRVERRAHTSE